MSTVAQLAAEVSVTGASRAEAQLTGVHRKIETTATGANKTGALFQRLDSQLGHFGVPFTGVLGTIGDRLGETEGHGQSFGRTLGRIGGDIAVGAAVGLAAVAVEGVHLADEFEGAHTRLETAITNTGGSYDQFAGKINATDRRMERFGFTNTQTEDSLARLTVVTRNAGKATELEGLAADVARGRHIDLSAATQALVRVEGGRYSMLGRLLGLSKAQVASIHNEHDAVSLLTNLYGGNASAYAGTFAGKLEVLKATGTDLAKNVGLALIPEIERLVSDGLNVVHVMQDMNSATGGMIGKSAEAAAALSTSAFVVTKLAGVYTSARTALTAMSAATAAGAVPVSALSVAQDAAAVAATTQAEADAALVVALDSVATSDGAVIIGENAVTAAMARATAAAEATAIADEQLAVANTAVATTAGGSGAAAGLMGGAIGALSSTAGIATVVLAGLALHVAASNKRAEESSGSILHQAASIGNWGHAVAQTIPGVGFLDDAWTLFGHHSKKTTDQLSSSESVVKDLDAATTKYADDLASGHASHATLAADAKAVQAAQSKQADIQGHVTKALQDGAAAADHAGKEAGAAAGGYDALAAGAAAAAQAVSALGAAQSSRSRGTESIDAALKSVDAHTQANAAARSFGQSLDALHGKGDSAAAGVGHAGGAAKTAAQQFFDAADKSRGLRDAELGVADAARSTEDAQRGVTDATRSLADARKSATHADADATRAAAALAEAQKNLDRVLHGQGPASKDAVAANEDLQKGHLDLRQAQLDAADAQDQLSKVTEDSTSSVHDREQADIRAAQAALRVTDAQAAVSEEQRVYNGILGGFSMRSQEAKDAQEQLGAAQVANEQATLRARDAQLSIEDAERKVTSATLAVSAAQRAQFDSTVEVARATASMRGELDSASGSAGGGSVAVHDYATQLDDATTKAIDFALKQAAAKGELEGTAGWALTMRTELEAAVAAEPALGTALAATFAALEHNAEVAQIAIDHVKTGMLQLGTATGLINGQIGILTPRGDITGARASGGSLTPGRMYTVGEEGVEVVRARQDGSLEVLSNPQTRHLLADRGSGNGATVDLGPLLAEIRDLKDTIAQQRRPLQVGPVYGTDAENLARQIEDRSRRQERLTRH